MGGLVWILVGATALAAGWYLRWVQRRSSHDLVFAGVTPGVVPPQPGAPVEPLETQEYRGTVAVAFSPPRDVPAGLAGCLVDAGAQARHVTATVVDLAVRGWLSIRPVEPDKPGGKAKDWLLTQTQPAPEQPLTPYESGLLSRAFAAGPEVRLRELAEAGVLQQTSTDLADETWRRGWYEQAGGRSRWAGLVGLPLLLALVLPLSPAVLGMLGLTFAGLLLALTGGVRVRRTATGTALRIQALGFKEYLATAEAGQLKLEEAAGVFSRYLPYAMALGVAEHWAKVFRDVLVAARDEGYELVYDDLGWLSGMVLADALGDLVLLDVLSDLSWLGDFADVSVDGFAGDLGGAVAEMTDGVDLPDFSDFGDFDF